MRVCTREETVPADVDLLCKRIEYSASAKRSVCGPQRSRAPQPPDSTRCSAHDPLPLLADAARAPQCPRGGLACRSRIACWSIRRLARRRIPWRCAEGTRTTQALQEWKTHGSLGLMSACSYAPVTGRRRAARHANCVRSSGRRGKRVAVSQMPVCRTHNSTNAHV